MTQKPQKILKSPNSATNTARTVSKHFSNDFSYKKLGYTKFRGVVLINNHVFKFLLNTQVSRISKI